MTVIVLLGPFGTFELTQVLKSVNDTVLKHFNWQNN